MSSSIQNITILGGTVMQYASTGREILIFWVILKGLYLELETVWKHTKLLKGIVYGISQGHAKNYQNPMFGMCMTDTP